MIIPSANQIKLDKIIKQDDLAFITSSEDYANKIRTECEQKLHDVIAEVEKIKHEAYTTTVLQLQEENAMLINQFKSNVTELLANVSDDMFKLVYKVLLKFGEKIVSPDTLRDIITMELNQVVINGVLKIKANDVSLVVLKQELSTEYFEKILWEIDKSLNNDECICITNLWTMRLSLKNTLNEIYLNCN